MDHPVEGGNVEIKHVYMNDIYRVKWHILYEALESSSGIPHTSLGTHAQENLIETEAGAEEVAKMEWEMER